MSAERRPNRVIPLTTIRLAADESGMDTGRTLQRVALVLAMVVAFIVMGSVFVPAPTTATPGDQPSSPAPERGVSVDPHDGLDSLGTFESAGHRLEVYATQEGPRYSVMTLSGRRLATLLTLEQLRERYPQVPIPDLGGGAIMLAEPVGN